jgi:hypothetical protein
VFVWMVGCGVTAEVGRHGTAAPGQAGGAPLPAKMFLDLFPETK